MWLEKTMRARGSLAHQGNQPLSFMICSTRRVHSLLPVEVEVVIVLHAAEPSVGTIARFRDHRRDLADLRDDLRRAKADSSAKARAGRAHLVVAQEQRQVRLAEVGADGRHQLG